MIESLLSFCLLARDSLCFSPARNSVVLLSIVHTIQEQIKAGRQQYQNQALGGQTQEGGFEKTYGTRAMICFFAHLPYLKVCFDHTQFSQKTPNMLSKKKGKKTADITQNASGEEVVFSVAEGYSCKVW